MKRPSRCGELAGRVNLPLLGLGVLLALVLVAVLIFFPKAPERSASGTAKAPQEEVPVVPEKEPPPVMEPDDVSSGPASVTVPLHKPQVITNQPAGPRIAIIIDDLGASRKKAERLLAIDAPLTFSILPHLKNSRKIAQAVQESGKTVMLHLPMEPKSKAHKAGEGALFVSYGNAKIIEALKSDFESVPGALGTNNHMGSLFTESREKMRVVLEKIGARGLFFVDSRTTAGSVAYETAIQLNVPSAKRDVFLDNDRDKAKITKNILLLVKVAKRKGSAIGIGHPYPETISALEETVPTLREMGVLVVPVTELLVVPAAPAVPENQ